MGVLRDGLKEEKNLVNLLKKKKNHNSFFFFPHEIIFLMHVLCAKYNIAHSLCAK
jgi:hypothetical protein